MAQVNVDQGTWILEDTRATPGVVARAIVSPTAARVLVRLLNPTTEPLTLHAGKQIAILEEVDKVLEAVNHIDAVSLNKQEPSRSDKLWHLVEESGADLTNLEKESLHELLLSYTRAGTHWKSQASN